MSLKWIPVLVCAGAIYFVFGGTFHAHLMASPEITIVNLGRSIGGAVVGAVSMLGELFWS